MRSEQVERSTSRRTQRARKRAANRESARRTQLIEKVFALIGRNPDVAQPKTPYTKHQTLKSSYNSHMASILVIGPHPDDQELGMGGSIAKLAAQGHRVHLLDMTNGEPTPLGSVERRGANRPPPRRFLA